MDKIIICDGKEGYGMSCNWGIRNEKNNNILISDADMGLAKTNLSAGARKLNLESLKDILSDCGVEYIG